MYYIFRVATTFKDMINKNILINYKIIDSDFRIDWLKIDVRKGLGKHMWKGCLFVPFFVIPKFPCTPLVTPIAAQYAGVQTMITDSFTSKKYPSNQKFDMKTYLKLLSKLKRIKI